ncbi:MAG: carboxypeptidase-like regulatory domain-containing protein, partial [Pedobacter sp.]
MKKNKLLLRTDLRSGPKKLIRISRFFALIVLVSAITFFQNKVNAQDTPGDNTAAISLKAVNSNSTELQQKRITGRVSDAGGVALPGVNIAEKGTTNGAITDSNGNFAISVSSSASILSISFIGYSTQEVLVGDKSTVDIILQEALSALDEVVVIGYGTQKRTTLTGAVSVVKGDVVGKASVANVTNSMAGQVAGIISRQQGGEPGSDNSIITIRGTATTGSGVPLIVIDGIVRSR